MAHPALRPGCTAAISVDGDDGGESGSGGSGSGEQAVVIAEIAPDSAAEAEKIIDVVRSGIGEAHGLSVRDVVLVQPGTIPKTSSGKIQRRASRAAYLGGTLALIPEPAVS